MALTMLTYQFPDVVMSTDRLQSLFEMAKPIYILLLYMLGTMDLYPARL
jgi:hypothetical protein